MKYIVIIEDVIRHKASYTNTLRAQ